jgi:putative oxidoreductase
MRIATTSALDGRGVSNVRAQLVALQESRYTRDGVLLVIRLTLAWVFIYHGAGKLFNFRNQGGIAGTTGFFQFVGIPSAHLFAYVAGVTEFFGGLFLLLGLAVPLAGLALVIDMLVAFFTTTISTGMLPRGFPGGVVADGFEINIALAALALVAASLGAGRFSVDYLIGLSKAAAALASREPQAAAEKLKGDVQGASRECSGIHCADSDSARRIGKAVEQLATEPCASRAGVEAVSRADDRRQLRDPAGLDGAQADRRSQGRRPQDRLDLEGDASGRTDQRAGLRHSAR